MTIKENGRFGRAEGLIWLGISNSIGMAICESDPTD
jgi:hypothetical protein